MRTYTAHLAPDRAPILCREGWSWGAALFGPVWLLTERAWIPALIEIAAVIALFSAVPSVAWRPALLGLFLLNGLLGRDGVRWSLERRGYALSHVVVAGDGDAAMLRLLAARPDLVERVR